jgi:hypothetical protein
MSADIWLGIVTVFMAVLGSIVSVHAPSKPSYKVAYVIAFVLAGAASVFFVIKISNENAAAAEHLKGALKKLEESTAEIANKTALNAQLQEKLVKQSDIITNLSMQNIAAVTGGSTFCYALATPANNEFLLMVHSVGKSPLHEVGVELIDVDKMRNSIAGKSTASFEEIQSYTVNFPVIPFLESTSGRTLTTMSMGALLKRNLQINFSSLNGIWSETLKLDLINGNWAQAIKVIKVLPVINGKVRDKTIYIFSTDNFPKKDGKIDWDN